MDIVVLIMKMVSKTVLWVEKVNSGDFLTAKKRARGDLLETFTCANLKLGNYVLFYFNDINVERSVYDISRN